MKMKRNNRRSRQKIIKTLEKSLFKTSKSIPMTKSKYKARVRLNMTEDELMETSLLLRKVARGEKINTDANTPRVKRFVAKATANQSMSDVQRALDAVAFKVVEINAKENKPTPEVSAKYKNLMEES